MIAPPKPVDEAARLEELRSLRLLDTEPEERFDRITRFASRLFDVPIAYIALLDADRQWFKSSCGLSATSTERSISFCGYTILQDEPLIISDTRKDERFHDNPLVTQPPGIRFYAGHPLRGPGGRNIGTLCLADTESRSASSLDRDVFQELAGIAEDELCMADLIETQRELLDVKDALLHSQRRLDGELRSAAEYVESLLPDDVDRPRLRITSSFVPSSELGGDFIGSVALGNDRVAVFLLDVTGHGIAASLLAVSISHAIRDQLQEPDLAEDPGPLLSRVNAAFRMQDNANRFATVWLGVFNEVTREVKYACAGHHPAIVVGDSGRRRLDESDLPIGIVDDTQYVSVRAQLSKNDRLYLFSDGVFEVKLPSGGQLGFQAFERLVEDAAKTAGTPVEAIMDSVRRMGVTDQFSDDATVLEVVLR
ncbi:MAG: GAF domain-containing SpoIIE family protein phosphatase [Planctomycetota bacterium]